MLLRNEKVMSKEPSIGRIEVLLTCFFGGSYDGENFLAPSIFLPQHYQADPIPLRRSAFKYTSLSLSLIFFFFFNRTAFPFVVTTNDHAQLYVNFSDHRMTCKFSMTYSFPRYQTFGFLFREKLKYCSTLESVPSNLSKVIKGKFICITFEGSP